MNNSEIVKPMKPFMVFCQKAIPLAFDESLSYLELLSYILNYINKDLVPATNTNTEAIIELRSFVTHYFDNLDIQEEIDNKLDEMAESGELAEIIAQYIELNGVLAYDTISEMTNAENIVDGSICRTLGRSSINDSKGSFYKVREITNQDVVDGYDIIALHDPNLIAIKINETEFIQLKDYCNGDGVTDVTQQLRYVLNKCATEGKYLFVNAGIYVINEAITIPQNVSIIGENKEKTSFICKTSNINMFNMVYENTTGANNTIKNLQLIGDADNVNGIILTNVCRCCIDNIQFIGLVNNIIIDGGGLNRIDNCTSIGTATRKAGRLWFGSTNQSEYGSVFTSVNSYHIDGGGSEGQGVQSPAIHLNRAVGMHFNDIISNDSNRTGIFIVMENDSQGNIFSNCTIVAYDTAVRILKSEGYSPIANTFKNVDVDQCANYAYLITGAKNLTINGGQITSSAIGTDKVINHFESEDVENVLITNINVSGYYTDPGTAIYLNNTKKVIIENNVFDACYQGISTPGTAKNCAIKNNNFTNCTYSITGNWQNNNNYISNNEGYYACDAIASPAFPASEVGVTNNTGYDVRVFIRGGTVSLIRINDVGALFTGGMVLLRQGETIKVNYSGEPSWNWVAM